jgi:hypothetical protein
LKYIPHIIFLSIECNIRPLETKNVTFQKGESMTTIAALDPGFGNTKLCIDGNVTVLQSAVSRPQFVGMAANGLRTVEVTDQVRIAETGEIYATGEHAWQVGAPLGGLDYSALASEPRKALFYASAARLLGPGHHQLDLVVGLPVPLLTDAAQAEMLMESLRIAYKTSHHFFGRGGEYNLEVNTLKVLAQPVGAWADWLIGPDLRPQKGGKDAEVAVLDIGLNTLDLYVIQGGRVEPRYIGGAKAGVRRILTSLNGHGQDLEEIDSGLRLGRLKPTRDVLNAWLSEIFSHIERVWPDLRRFSAIVPAGGGAVILGDQLRTSLIARGAILSWPSDPITANALGLWKWGAYAASKR